MPFLTTTDLRTQLYDYQVQLITEQNSTITQAAISAAIAEVRSYLANRYDCDRIFATEAITDPDTNTTTDNRNPLVVRLCCAVAAYHLVKLANPDAIYDRYRNDYTDAISILQRIADGSVSPDLPYRNDQQGQPSGTLQFASHHKFNHNF